MANAFVGMTKKEVKKGIIPEGDFKTEEGTLEENWIRWNQEAETYLRHQEDKRGKEFRGRGQKVVYVKKNKIAPPQDNTKGCYYGGYEENTIDDEQNEEISDAR
eukprot:1548490-Heterocapsa_arctica.AAC.1